MVNENGSGGEATGTTYYYIQDRRYSVVALIDINANSVERYRYQAFGRWSVYTAAGGWLTTPTSNTTLENPFGFTGRRYDPETATTATGQGLWHYRNRMYSARLGRFLQRDPAGYVDGYHLYAYVRNNPLGYMDALGLFKQAFFDAMNGNSLGNMDYSSSHYAASRYNLTYSEQLAYDNTPSDLPVALRVAMATGREITLSAGATGKLLGNGFEDYQALTNGFDNTRVSSSRNTLVTFNPDGTTQTLVPLECASTHRKPMVPSSDYLVAYGYVSQQRLNRPLVTEYEGTSRGYLASSPRAYVGPSSSYARTGAIAAVNEFDSQNLVRIAEGKVSILSFGADSLGGFVPGYGEYLDARVLFGRDVSLFDRGVAALSLGVNVATVGLGPNFGAPSKAVRTLGDVTSSGRASSKIIRQANITPSYGGITHLSRNTVVDGLIGVTEQGNRVANGITTGNIRLNLLGDELFDKAYVLKGGEGAAPRAFQYGKNIYLRGSSDTLISDAVHEGTHVLDELFMNVKVDYSINPYTWEKRAFFYERQFQIGSGANVEFPTIQEMNDFIYSNYKPID